MRALRVVLASPLEERMLEHIPGWLGHLMRNFRAGHEKLTVAHHGIALADARIELASPAFADGGRLPIRFTADGEGVSPPLVWGDVPAGTQSLALIVEDPDAPTPSPLVHALVWKIPPGERGLAEGAVGPDGGGAGTGQDTGRNSFLAEGWLPPDPPTGHGTHDYVFQLFALSAVSDIGPSPGRSAFVDAITGKVLATGLLVGRYSREDVAANADAAGSAGAEAAGAV